MSHECRISYIVLVAQSCFFVVQTCVNRGVIFLDTLVQCYFPAVEIEVLFFAGSSLP